MRALFQQLSRMRGGDTTHLEISIGLLKCVDRLHRRGIENSVYGAGVKTAIREDPLDAFDRSRTIGVIQSTIEARNEETSKSFRPRCLPAAF